MPRRKIAPVVDEFTRLSQAVEYAIRGSSLGPNEVVPALLGMVVALVTTSTRTPQQYAEASLEAIGSLNDGLRQGTKMQEILKAREKGRLKMQRRRERLRAKAKLAKMNKTAKKATAKKKSRRPLKAKKS